MELTNTSKFLPFLSWILGMKRSVLRSDIEAGLIGALLVLPQAIALATLAGMPPEYGIYTSIIPATIAALWCSSWHSVSGPNTALCVLIAFSVAPFANPGTTDYISLVLALTLMVGIIQVLIGFLKLGSVLDFISHTVISAIVISVGIMTIIAASSSFIGVLSNFGEPVFIRVYQLVHDIPQANLFALSVGLVTVLSGLVSKKYWRRYSLVIALFVGSLFTFGLNATYGSVSTNIEMIGFLSMALFPFQIPQIDLGNMPIILQLISSAFAIAFLGLMQSVVISRSIAVKSNQRINTNQEILGQGLSNLVGSFFSSFASSGSFNRSAANYSVGAKTPLAVVAASLFLVAAIVLAAPMIAYMPLPVIAGVLVLVGLGLIDVGEIKRALMSRQESLIFFSTLSIALFMGLNAGVFAGVLISLITYLWKASTPNVSVKNSYARDGRQVAEVTIDGNLFFGSLRYVETMISNITVENNEKMIIVLRTNHLTYIDVPAAIMLASEARRWKENGHWFYLFVVQNSATKSLEKSGLLSSFTDEEIIYQHLPHPMKDIIHPNNNIHRPETSTQLLIKEQTQQVVKGKGVNMKDLAKRLRMTRLIGPLSLEQFNLLLENCEIQTAGKNELIYTEYDEKRHHIILLQGEIETQRIWLSDDETQKCFSKTFVAPKNISGGFTYISSISNNTRVRALTEIQYLLIDGAKIDEMLGWNQQLSSYNSLDENLRKKISLVKNTRVFQRLPMDRVIEAFKNMETRKVVENETIVTQGDKGDRYYLITEGEAEVWQTDPFTDETILKATLGAGDSFGEEALLQNGFRNATITMTTPGELLFLDHDLFEALVKPHFVEEIDAQDTAKMIKSGQAKLLDCRYDMEFEDSRIPGATHISLDRTRWDIHQLDPDQFYIVYCRSGRRSLAAAFLLNERNVKAMSLKGGIKEWPYAIDETPLEEALV